MNQNDKRRLIIFTLITFSVSWSIWILSGVLFRKGFVYDSQWLFSQIGVFTPTVVAVILMGIDSKQSRNKSAIIILLSLLIFIVGFMITNSNSTSVKDFSFVASLSVFLISVIIIFIISRYKYFYLSGIESKTKNGINVKWILTSLFFLPILFLVAWLFINIPGKELQIFAFQDGFIKFIQILFIAFSMNLILGGSMGEEFGWRGYVLPILLKKYNPTATSIVLGLIWAFWHFPIDITSSILPGPFAFLFRIIWTLPLTIIFTWLFIKTNGSILIALLLHTSVNVLPDLGFIHYESSIILMTLLLIITASIIAFRPEMRFTIKWIS